MARGRLEGLLTAVLWAVGLCYALLMLQLLFRFHILLDPGRAVLRRVNLEPLHTVRLFWRMYRETGSAFALENLLGNVVLFLPLGLYLGVAGKGRLDPGLLLVWLIPVGVECAQYALGVGACDVDDVLLNAVGGMAGLFGYRALARLCGPTRARSVVAVLSLLVGAPFLWVQAGVLVRSWR